MTAQSTVEQLITLLEKRRDSGVDSVTAEDRLDVLGIDSIDLAYLLSNFERTHDADFSDADFEVDRYATVADLAQAIQSRLDG
jgi:acyl carrier protein